MASESATTPGQSERWNGPAAQAWVDAQALVEQVLRPFEDLLVEVARERGARSVLDVGCGTGATTFAVARATGARCTGVDISGQMVAAARARGESDRVPATFVLADAQTHAFEPGGFDLIMSRFGVMFFADPVAAFANLRRAARPGAALACVVWRDMADNPFATVAERAAQPLLPHLPARDPRAPGQFALADAGFVSSILTDSGWGDIAIRPLDIDCTMPESELVGYFSRMGPVGLALLEADESTRDRVIRTVRAAFDPYVHGAEVRFTAACWMVSARSRAENSSS